MAIEKKLIHFGKLADFEAQLTAGNILDRSIVFIQDAKKIWTHGTYYDCSEGTAAGDELWLEDPDGNAFCDRDILVDGNVRTNSTVVTSSIGVPLEEGGFVTGDRGQILIATGEGTVEWDDISIPTKVSDLENDSNFVSSDNLKTINGESIVGSGNISISGGSGTITEVKANGTSIATSGVANIPAASTSAYGVTKLSSATNSTSTTLAATASAVKAAYDLASGKASMSDVNTAIANAITTTLNTSV